MAETQPKKNAPPIARVQVGTVQGAVWRRETDKGAFYSATFTNRYKDAKGDWHDGDSYSHMDLLAVQEAARQLYADIDAARAKDKAAGKAQPGDEG
jgi:hypothetical protein